MTDVPLARVQAQEARLAEVSHNSGIPESTDGLARKHKHKQKRLRGI